MYSVSCLNKLKQSNSSSAYRYNNLTINSIASTVGISLTEDECLHVADEMYYKTKELAYMTKVILNRNKCDKLDIDDVRRSLQSIGGVELYGHDYIHAPKFLYIPEACVFVEEDPEILVPDSALDEAIYFQKRPPIIQASWVMPSNFSEEKAALEPPTRYFLTVARTIVNGIPDLVKVALEDLRTNPKVGAECAYFLNLVASIVKQQIVRGIHLTDNLIATVEAISINKYICVSPYMATNRVANALLKIVIEAPETNNDNDIILRIRAGTLLAKVIREWKIEFKQYMDTVKHLLEYLLDTNAPIQSQFGSVVTLTAFGELALITYVWPILEKYIMILAGRVYISRYFDPYTLHIMIAVFAATRATYDENRWLIGLLSEIETQVYMIFGDSTTPLRQTRKKARFFSDCPALYPKVRLKRNHSLLKLRSLKLFTEDVLGSNYWLMGGLLPDTEKQINHLSQRYKPFIQSITNKWHCFQKDIFEKNLNLSTGGRYYVNNKNSKTSQASFFYISRSLKFQRVLYKTSSVGDINLLL